MPCRPVPAHAGLLLSWVKLPRPAPQDFANHNAFHLLERYRPQLACFNGGWGGQYSETTWVSHGVGRT